eukprot:1160704-Pelagomonas_calceolata.AAC.6
MFGQEVLGSSSFMRSAELAASAFAGSSLASFYKCMLCKDEEHCMYSGRPYHDRSLCAWRNQVHLSCKVKAFCFQFLHERLRPEKWTMGIAWAFHHFKTQPVIRPQAPVSPQISNLVLIVKVLQHSLAPRDVTFSRDLKHTWLTRFMALLISNTHCVAHRGNTCVLNLSMATRKYNCVHQWPGDGQSRHAVITWGLPGCCACMLQAKEMLANQWMYDMQLMTDMGGKTVDPSQFLGTGVALTGRDNNTSNAVTGGVKRKAEGTLEERRKFYEQRRKTQHGGPAAGGGGAGALGTSGQASVDLGAEGAGEGGDEEAEAGGPSGPAPFQPNEKVRASLMTRCAQWSGLPANVQANCCAWNVEVGNMLYVNAHPWDHHA